MQNREKVSMNLIVAEAVMMVNDQKFERGLSSGWYRSQCQRAMEKLAIQTFCEVITSDFVMPVDCLQDNLPTNCFNIRELYAWGGSCCTPENSAIIHFKRLYNNKGGGKNYTALRKDTGSQQPDPFYGNFFPPISNPSSISSIGGSGDLLYANIQNGQIMFSSSCSSWNNYRIVYNGMGGEIGDEVMIPRILRECATDMVVESALRAFAIREPRIYRSLSVDAYERLYNRQTGSFWDAMRTVKAMDTWSKEDYAVYQNRGDW